MLKIRKGGHVDLERYYNAMEIDFDEKELLGTLAGQYRDKTVLIISHRNSTLSGCSRLVRIENGRTVE